MMSSARLGLLLIVRFNIFSIINQSPVILGKKLFWVGLGWILRVSGGWMDGWGK